jgi:hypothetical protein
MVAWAGILETVMQDCHELAWSVKYRVLPMEGGAVRTQIVC